MNPPDQQIKNKPGLLWALGLTVALCVAAHADGSTGSSVQRVTVWETHELTFTSQQQQWSNPYLDVDFWVRVRGPDGLERKVYGFWDGGNTWKARVVATEPGHWIWVSHSDQDWAFRARRLK